MAPPSAIDIVAVSDTEAITIPDPTIDGIASRRLKAGKLVAGTASATNSALFKSPFTGKPKAKRWDHYITVEGKARHPSALKGAAEHLKKPGLISLGGGLPLAENFPIEEISIKVPTAPHFSEKDARESGKILTAGKYDASEGSSVYDLAIALNYAQGTGSAQMIRFITEHTELVCNPAYADWGCVLTVGSTSSLDKGLRTFCERGDVVLAEEYTYSSAVESAAALGVNFIPIKMDSEGLLPEEMDDILNTWDEKSRGARKPHVLYTVPTGQNPTGATQSATRRKAIYKVAQKHDIYIFEDEPYFFLQMQPYTGPDSPSAPPPASNEAFLKTLVPTYLSLDVDGRVMRMDSFSKVIAPGTRVGWVTASEQIIERIVRANESSVQNPSGLSQIVLFKLLDEHWGHAGYFQWLINLRMEYTRRRDTLLDACEKFLPKDLVSWNPPAAGMFLWMKVDYHKHPAASRKTILEIEDEIYLAAVEEGVLVAKGSWFIAQRGDFVPEELFFRATFAAESQDKMTHAIERFGAAVRKTFGPE
ncbi:related to ARO8-aromatic amino acid aminotransferase I [Phialocephala subalpina]|uniref:aromatic-amino-acid transaminase n=1 Tax=Phialocephala subalpina TaxID=576137 RepID=A0A1L7WCG1_9HELO|nr:related to ARO8-aromatic amino acid aminotransferase I [Phialocephala subalpina]